MKDDYVQELVDILGKLRASDGCPWDREQTHQTLKRYLIEETGELLDAIDAEDDAEMVDELGDLLLQIVFHCQIAREDRRFDLQDVARSECEKMIRRHPHVFADAQADHPKAVLDQWERIKQAEKRDGDTGAELPSAVAGVPRHLPALHRAQKVLRKAGRTGFEWPTIAGAVDKVDEEMAEMKEALGQDDREALKAELGDLLLSLVNLCRWLDFEAEDVLQQAVRTFQRRFQAMEKDARESDVDLSGCDPGELLVRWKAAAREKE